MQLLILLMIVNTVVFGLENPAETIEPVYKEIQSVACEDEQAAQAYDVFKKGDWDVESLEASKAHDKFNLINGNTCFFLQGTVADIEEEATVDYQGKPVFLFTVFIHKLDECKGKEEVCERKEFFILAR